MSRRVVGLLLLPAGAVCAALITAAPASAGVVHGGTRVVDWQTSLTAGVTKPVDASSVTWPQKLVSTVPACHSYWIQEDVYRYATPQDKATVDALLSKGVLTDWHADDSVGVSWTFLPPVECAPSSPASPASVKTSPEELPPVASPVTSSGIGTGAATRSVVVALSSPSVPAAPPPPQTLPNTGANDVPALLVAGFTLVGVGGAALQAGRRRR